MIVVKVESWPNGKAGWSKEIGRLTLENITDPVTGCCSDYKVEIESVELLKSGVVTAHHRPNGVWRLLRLALEVCNV